VNAAAVARLAEIIPDDRLKVRRLANLARASRAIVATDPDGQPLGLVYVRTILGIPNVTWIVAERARGCGIASRLVAQMQKHCTWLTAICRNDPSVRLARKSGFRVAFGRFAVWRAHRPAAGRPRNE
jgi:RimJ/RimL family protein N-acetyltransferase